MVELVGIEPSRSVENMEVVDSPFCSISQKGCFAESAVQKRYKKIPTRRQTLARE
jgi:hypothetical protein